MMLATTKVENVEQFLKIFSTKGMEKRQQHGSRGAMVYADPAEADRVWVIFDWTEEGFKSLSAFGGRMFQFAGERASIGS